MTARKKAPPKIAYTKPALSLQDQLQQLKERGLLVADDAQAIHYPGQLNYYRPSAYWLPFEVDHNKHQIKPNTPSGSRNRGWTD